MGKLARSGGRMTGASARHGSVWSVPWWMVVIVGAVAVAIGGGPAEVLTADIASGEATLSGRLTLADHSAVAAAMVSTGDCDDYQRSGEECRHVWTDIDGSFSLRMPLGDHDLRVGTDNNTRSDLPSFWLDSRVDLTGDRALDLVLPTPAGLTVRVLEANGAPAVGAVVRTPTFFSRELPELTMQTHVIPFDAAPGVRMSGTESATDAVTDASGSVRLALLPTEDLAQLEVSKNGPGHVHRQAVRNHLPVLADIAVTVVLPPAATLSGRVQTADGGAVGGAHVSLCAESEPIDPDTCDTAVASPDGSFSLQKEPGRWLLTLSGERIPLAGGSLTTFSVSTELNLATDQVHNLVLPATVTVTASVRDPAGAALSGVEVTQVAAPVADYPIFPGVLASGSSSGSATTDGSGTAAIHLLPTEGALDMVATLGEGHGATPRRAEVYGETGDHDSSVDITLPEVVLPPGPATLSGRVQTAGGGAVGGVRVSLCGLSEPIDPDTCQTAVASPDGSFSLQKWPGRWALVLSGERVRLASGSLTTFSVSTELYLNTDQVHNLVLPATVTVTASVRDPAGAALSGVEVTQIAAPVADYPIFAGVLASGSSSSSATTGASGTATMHLLPTMGSLDIVATRRDGPGAPLRRAEVHGETGDHDSSVNITLPGARGSTVQVNLPPVPVIFGVPALLSAVVHSQPADGMAPTGMVKFSIDGVPQPLAPVDRGKAVLSTSLMSVGSHTVIAEYLGDEGHDGSVSAPRIVTVVAVGTKIAVSPSSHPSAVGAPVTFTATVKPFANRAPVPIGLVVFVVDGVAQAPEPVTGGKARITLSALSIGTHTVSAEYFPYPGYLGSTSATLTHHVKRP